MPDRKSQTSRARVASSGAAAISAAVSAGRSWKSWPSIVLLGDVAFAEHLPELPQHPAALVLELFELRRQEHHLEREPLE